ncbi:membrane hypothetical protein [Vibrio chagasii]|nr:membrane hypothetical protein [Vibrio chagasii]
MQLNPKRYKADELFYILICIMFIPLIWVSTLADGVDVTNHGAQIATIKDLVMSRDSILTEHFEWSHFSPYILSYATSLLLSFFFSIDTSMRLLMTVTNLLSMLFIYKIAKESKTDLILASLLIPTIFGFSYHWGYLSFNTSIWMGLASVHYSLCSLKYNQFKDHQLKLTFLSIALAFSHALVFLVTCVILFVVACYNLSQDNLKKIIRASVPFFITLGTLLIWSAYISSSANEVGDIPAIWTYRMTDWQHIIGGLNGLSIFNTPAFLGVFVLCIPIVTGGKVRSFKYTCFAIFGIVGIILIPTHTFGIWDVRPRLTFLIPMIFIFAFKGRSDIPFSSVTLILASLGYSFITLYTHANEISERQDKVIDMLELVPNNQRILMIISDHKHSPDKSFNMGFNLHAHYQTAGRGIVDPNFATAMTTPLRFKDEANLFLLSGGTFEGTRLEGSLGTPTDFMYRYLGYPIEEYDYAVEISSEKPIVDVGGIREFEGVALGVLMQHNPPFSLWKLSKQ